ncbi:hypothetical protein ACLOJK_022670 [Asimina triloba]
MVASTCPSSAARRPPTAAWRGDRSALSRAPSHGTRPSSIDQPHLHRLFLPSGQQPSVNPSTLMASMRNISPHLGILFAFINPSSPARNQPPQIAPKLDSRPIQHPSAALLKIPNPRQANGSRSSIEFRQEAKQQYERPRLHLKHPFAAPDNAP